MKLKNYQYKALEKIINNNNNILFWGRQKGKSFVLSKFIEHYILNNTDKDILFLVNTTYNIKNFIDRFLDWIDDMNIILDIKTYYNKFSIKFINGNVLYFKSVLQELDQFCGYIKPDVVIYDDFYIKNLNNFNFLFRYLETSKCKTIFTSFSFNLEFVKILDYDNNYYINIIPNLETINTNKFIEKELSYKPISLLDFDILSYKRKKKLQIIENNARIK